MSEDRLKEQCDYTMKKNRELIIENEKLKKLISKVRPWMMYLKYHSCVINKDACMNEVVDWLDCTKELEK